MPSLIVVRGQQPGRILAVENGAVLGRGSRSSLQLPDPSLSRQHCRIIHSDKGWFIEDLNSTNGVYVNGQHVREPQQLHGGDLLTLGHVQLLFSEEQCSATRTEAPAESKPIPTSDPAADLLQLSEQLQQIQPAVQPNAADYQPLASLLLKLAAPLQRVLLIWHDPVRDRLLTLLQAGESALMARVDLPLLQFVSTYQQTVVSLSASEDPRLPVKQAAEKLGMQSLLYIPIVQENQVLGLLLADSTEREDENCLTRTLHQLHLAAQLLTRTLLPSRDTSTPPLRQAEQGLQAWQKQHLDGQPPFLPGLQWLQSHQHQDLMLTALHYQHPEPHRHLLLAMDAQGDHHPRLRNLLLDELSIWLDCMSDRGQSFDNLSEALIHRALGLPVSLHWCLLHLDIRQNLLQWHNHHLFAYTLDKLQLKTADNSGEIQLTTDGPAFILGNQPALQELPWNQWPELAPALLSRADAALSEKKKNREKPDHFLVIVQASD